MPSHKTLLGFVGSPFTLYSYAVEGAHKGNLNSTKLGLFTEDMRFVDLIFENLLGEMKMQAEGGADGICLFDTACGEVDLQMFKGTYYQRSRKLRQHLKSHILIKKLFIILK